MYTVYKHTSPSGKIYIGITGQTVNERWRRGRGYIHCVCFWHAIQKHGWENIKHEILFEGLTKEEAEAKEIELIAKYKSNQKGYGYNISNGGSTIGKHSEETRKKISAIHKGKIVSEETKAKMRQNHADVSKENNPWYGKHLPLETRIKLSISHKGKQVGEKKPMYGKHHSEEVRKIQSEHRKGKCIGKNNHKSKRIVQMNFDDEIIKIYECISDVEREMNLPRGGGGHISACAKGRNKTAYGFKWRYDEENAI